MSMLDSRFGQRVRRSGALRPVGIAAYRAVDRLRPAKPGPRVVANSMPKSGTHLLTAMLEQLDGMRFSGHVVMSTPNTSESVAAHRLGVLERRVKHLRPSHFMGAHLSYDPRVEEVIEHAGVQLVTILRDPRAVVSSALHYLHSATWVPIHAELREALPTDEAILQAIVRGNDRFQFPEIGTQYGKYVDWLDARVGLTVRFEDLVGGRGGGSDDVQVETATRILEYLGIAPSAGSIEDIARGMFSETAITFRAGKIDSWRDDLPADVCREIEQRCGASMERLGYA